MGFLKAITYIALWVLLSFVWVSLGQARSCPNYGAMGACLKPYPVLNSFYHFYVDRQDCVIDQEAFFKTLAASEQLSIKLNQVKVTFEQFYVPLYHLLSVEGCESSDQKIQSDLSVMDHSLNKALKSMNAADQDYFRAVVLLDFHSEFVREEKEDLLIRATLTKRLNSPTDDFSREQIDFQDVVSPPYERIFAH